MAAAEHDLVQANRWINLLHEKIRLMMLDKYGPPSEKLTSQQLSLLEEEPGVTVDEVEAEAGREQYEAPPAAKTKAAKKKHPGRRPLPAHLRRVETVIVCPPEACQCPGCGVAMPVIGHDRSEMLDVIPADYFVRVTLREKRACRSCGKSAVVAAPLPERILEKSVASDAVVVETVVAKYGDHLPLYRQEAMLARDAGLEITRATLDGWVMGVGGMLIPVVEAMRRELLALDYLQADETTLPVQMKDGRGQAHQAYLWQYGAPGRGTVFDFRMSRERAGPEEFLRGWKGILQTDGYQAYDTVGGEGVVHVGCWAHARRKFFEALTANRQDKTALEMVVRVDALFRVDAEARKQELSLEGRHQMRQERSVPMLDELKRECWRIRERALPKSLMAKAVTYTLNQWTKLVGCFRYAQVELSNNIAENSMRGVALGRKNWLHVGSEKAAPKVAAILSVVESCKRLGVPPKRYLASVLPGLQNRTLAEVVNLTPARWAAARA